MQTDVKEAYLSLGEALGFLEDAKAFLMRDRADLDRWVRQIDEIRHEMTDKIEHYQIGPRE